MEEAPDGDGRPRLAARPGSYVPLAWAVNNSFYATT